MKQWMYLYINIHMCIRISQIQLVPYTELALTWAVKQKLYCFTSTEAELVVSNSVKNVLLNENDLARTSEPAFKRNLQLYQLSVLKLQCSELKPPKPKTDIQEVKQICSSVAIRHWQNKRKCHVFNAELSSVPWSQSTKRWVSFSEA